MLLYEPDVVVESVVEPPLLVVDVVLVLVLVHIVPLTAMAAVFCSCQYCSLLNIVHGIMLFIERLYELFEYLSLGVSAFIF